MYHHVLSRLIFTTSLKEGIIPHLVTKIWAYKRKNKIWALWQWMNCSQLVRSLVRIGNEVCCKLCSPHRYIQQWMLELFPTEVFEAPIPVPFLHCDPLSWGSWKNCTVTWLSCCQKALSEEILLFSLPEPVMVKKLQNLASLMQNHGC